MLETNMQDPSAAAAAAASSNEEPALGRGLSSSTVLSKCNCLMPKRIMARSSSSESLDGTRRSTAKEGAAASVKWFLYNVYHKIKSGGGHGAGGLGTYTGVLIPTCENMWGVLIFLRFFYIVGNAGVWQTFLIVFISFLCAMLTTMSLSAIATNGPIEQGGTYYLISRALGPRLGGAVGLLYYLGVILLSVLEALGSVEMIVFTFPGLDFQSSNRIIAGVILIVLGLLVFFGIKFVSKLGLAFFGVVLYTMLSFYLGLGLAPRGSAPSSDLTGLSWTTFKSNWSPGYLPGKSFSTAVSLFFPCFTGILSGADRATNLRQPEKSVPQGTVGAVVTSFIMYTSYMGLWAAVGKRNYLLGIGGDHAMLKVVRDVAYPVATITELGIIIASIAQAMQCLIISPRLLQAIAVDGVVPFLGPLAKVSKKGEPQRALMITTFLCFAFAMMGSLNTVAPLVSICFLTCYSALNLSCLILSAVNAPSWRPRWKYYHWTTALMGFLACLIMNFVIVWYWAVVAIVLLIFIYAYIDFRQVEVNWGTGLGGLCLQIAVRGILSVGDEARYTVNWRPQLLCLSKPRTSWTADDHAGHEFLFFASQLKKGQGLCVVTVILEGKLEEMTAQAAAEKVELENCMAAAKVTGFGRVLISPTYREGKTYAIQSSGLGSLEPNTIVLGWPTKWRDVGHEDSAEILLETLTECQAVDKAVLLCVHLDKFPVNDDYQEGVIDVWWIVHDGGLLLLLAHLLHQHKIWRKCKVRVHTVAEKLSNPDAVKRRLEELLESVRIKAEVQVLELDDPCIVPYTFDYTIRAEEAKAFTEELMKYRSVGFKNLDLRGSNSPESASRNSLSKKSGERNRQSAEFDRSRDKIKDVGVPNFHLSEFEGVCHTRRREVRRGALGLPALNIDSPNDGIDSLNEKELARENPNVVVSQSELQNSPQVIPSLLSSSPKPKILGAAERSPTSSASQQNEVLLHSQHRPEDGLKPAVGRTTSVDCEQLGDGSSEQSPNTTLETTRSEVSKPRKEAHWADDDGRSMGGRAGPDLEILVDVGTLATSSDYVGAEGNSELENGQLCSRQVYPGSPAEINNAQAIQDIPEPMRRTWETFSQSYSPTRLNEIIVEHSRNAQLILINLPDHYKGMEPNRYMEYCEELCKGLDGVLLVHSTGKELWGGPSHLRM